MDFGFKRVMKKPEVVIGFLNTILHISEADRIQSVTYLNTELNSGVPLGRDFIVDILCQSINDKHYLIEIHNDFRIDYTNKALFELSRLITQWDNYIVHQEVREEIFKKAKRDNDSLQGVKTNWKGSHAAITVMITNREYGENVFKTNFPAQSIREPEIINTYRMTHSIHPDQYLGNDARVVLVMLSNFHKNEEDLQTIEDTQLSTGTDRIPGYKHIENLNKVQDDNDEGLKQFYQALNKEAMEMKTDLKCYERGINNLNKVLDSKKMEGIIEGKREIVCNMLSKNLSDDIILECSNLTFDELAEIKRSLE